MLRFSKGSHDQEARLAEKPTAQGILDAIELQSSGLTCAGYFLLCFLTAILPCVMTILLWSSMGQGDACIRFLEDNQVLSVYCIAFVGVLFMFLYLLDFFWPPHLPGQYLTLFDRERCLVRARPGPRRRGPALHQGVHVNADAGHHPLRSGRDPGAAPGHAAAAAATPAKRRPQAARAQATADLQEALKTLALLAGEQKDSRQFYWGAMGAFLLSGTATLLTWGIWAMKAQVDLSGMELGHEAKERTFILWVNPLVAGVANLAFGFFILLRVRLSQPYEDTDKLKIQLILKVDGTEEVDCGETLVGKHLQQTKTMEEFARLPEDQQQKFARQHLNSILEISRTLKVVGCSLLCLLGALYVAAELVAADSRVAQLVVGFVGVIFLSFVGFLCLSFGRLMSNTRDWCLECPLGKSAVSLSQNSWIRAGLVCMALPFVPAILLLSAANQLVRRGRGLYARIPPPRRSLSQFEVEDAPRRPRGNRPFEVDADDIITATEPIKVAEAPEDKWLTARAMDHIDAMREWDWIATMRKLYICGFCFVCYTLFPKYLNVFLAWLSSFLKELPFALTVFATMLSGIICFLLPPVPGLPVYLFAGLIMGSTCPAGFWAGCAISVAIGFVLKLIACAIQQKLIGESLGNSLRIKSEVGLNKPFIRAIEAVLRQPGWSRGKVAILCAGPDWPTSVMAGLLRLPLCQMELGTVPIIVFIAPCTLTGAFYLKKGESEAWTRAANLMVAFATLVNMVMWVSAAWAIQDELDSNQWEVTKPLVRNIDLDWLDYSNEQVRKSCVIAWGDLPKMVRLAATMGAVLEVLLGHLFYWRSAVFFGKFEVADDVSTLEWYGNDGFIRPAGALGLILVMLGWIGYVVLSVFMWRKQAGPFAAKRAQLKDREALWKERRMRMAVSAEQQVRVSFAEMIMGAKGRCATGIEKE
eukprot:CAMPEP_0168491294 /NCGR_PEP_ID=MMETSP0228-20121227/69621_1 /TAXON_ID=133427 /ORGANISM="Protoceratium reticulatum, Strain CCCM 535 (=CCMP 1889)" /LENGTH=926 /DNA_ID=CAMNT_0008508025 /DNA_START=41 /DNA_END=2822 /DNA_ORIENTATION=-